MKSTNKIFRRRSGVLNALAKAPNTLSSHKFPLPRAGQGPSKSAGQETNQGPSDRRRISSAGTHEPWTSSHLGDGSPGRGDLLTRGLGELVHRNLQCHGQFAVTQYLDRLTTTNRALGDQVGNA